MGAHESASWGSVSTFGESILGSKSRDRACSVLRKKHGVRIALCLKVPKGAEGVRGLGRARGFKRSLVASTTLSRVATIEKPGNRRHDRTCSSKSMIGSFSRAFGERL